MKVKKLALLEKVNDYILRWRRRLFDVVPAGAKDSMINLRILQVRPEKPEILPPTLVADPITACDKQHAEGGGVCRRG